MDDILEYLKKCGGRDSLSFDTIEQADLARHALQEQWESEGIDIHKRPILDQFQTILRLSLRQKEPSDASELTPIH